MSEEYTEYYISKAPKALRCLDYKRRRAQDWFVELPAEGRLYAIGCAIIAISVVVSLFKRHEACDLAQFGAVVFAFGLLPAIQSQYEWLWKNVFGKVLVAGLIALVTNIAYGFGRQIVSELIGTNPESLSATVNVATILFSPVLTLMVVAIGGIFIFIGSLYVGTLAFMASIHFEFPGKGKCICLWLCRLVALGIAVFGSWSVLQGSSTYGEWTTRRCAEYLYSFDLYHDAQLTTNNAEKVVALSDGRLLVGSPQESGGYQFEVRNPKEQKTTHF